MKSFVVGAANKFGIEDLPVPQPGAGEVLVKVAYAGICGSDMHIIHGQNPFATYPRITGHEFVGTVENIGNKVTKIQAGQKVVINPAISCGKCRPCVIGRPNVCTRLKVVGVHRDGGFTEFQSVPETNIHVLPDGLSLRDAALIEPYSIAANVFDRMGYQKGDQVLVYGAGVIGLTVIQVARILGIPSIVVDIVDDRLEVAEMLGAGCVINSMTESVEDRVTEMTDGEGIPLIVDAAGIPGLVPEILKLAAPAGSVCLLGFSSTPSEVSQIEVIKKELTIVGSRLNNNMFPTVIGWMADGLLDTEKLITHEFPLEKAPEAINLIENSPHLVRKVLLNIQ
ncbi:Zn-dependent oxidoreductase [Parasalinivibrio latis]|uniref:Zn-dependent oxidoreductase n=1 Tax=Parasalinivibrio latis TaxID=2952610 RepID=UPI0030E1C43D